MARNDGVAKKIRNQVKAWRSLEVDVEVFCSYRRDGALENGFHFYNNGFWSKDEGPASIIKDIKEFSPDIVYFRYEVWKPYYDAIFKTFPAIVEINSDDVVELKLRSRRNLSLYKIYLWNLLTRKRIFRRARGLISVTNEMLKYKHFAFNIPKAVVPNSIDYDSEQIRKKPVKDGPIRIVLCTSFNQPWIGLDKILKMAEKLGEGFELHIIGIENIPMHPSNVIFHGYLEGEAYYKAISSCQIAVGSLAISRNGLNEACPLKIREYAAMGMPIIIAHEDTALIGETPEWVLKLPNEEGISIMERT